MEASCIDELLAKIIKMENFDIKFSVDTFIDEKGILVDQTNKVMIITVFNVQKEIVGYILADLEDYEKLANLHYHIRSDAVKGPGSTSLKKSIAFHILDLDRDDERTLIYRNSNRMDLRKENLNIVTNAQAIQMRSKKKEGKNYIGVSTCGKGFRATIKGIFIGYSLTEEVTAKVYDIYAIHFYGIDAKTNNLLSEEEKGDIVKNGIPEEYKKTAPRELPKYISKAREDRGAPGYYYNFRYEGRSYQKTYDTMEEAVIGMAERRQLLAEEKLRKEQLDNSNNEPINDGDNDNNDDQANNNEPLNNNLVQPKKLKEIRHNLPDEITVDYLKTIKHVQIFKEIIRKKKWNGIKGNFALNKINQNNLKENINKAIGILNAERSNMKVVPAPKVKLEKELEMSMAQLVTNSIIVVEDNYNILKGNKNNFIIDLTNNTVKIPLINSKHTLVGHTLVSLNKYDFVKDYSFHLKIDRHGKKTAMCGKLGKRLEYLIFGNPREGYQPSHKNKDSLDNRDENVIFIEKAHGTHYNTKRENYYSSDYKGVTRNNDTSFRATISYKGDYIHIGTFEDEIIAAIVADIYSVHYYRGLLPTNGFLTQEEIDDILENGIPKEFLRPVKETLLPGIFKKGDYYGYEIRIGKITYIKMVSQDIDETILAQKNKIPKIQRLWDGEKERLRPNMMRDMTRDNRGYGIIYLYDREGNITGQTVVNENIWFETNLYSWHMRDDGYVGGYIEGKNVLMHTYLYEKYKGEIGKLSIDHENINPLDNFLENLRVATRNVQGHNQNKKQGSILKEKGVTINGNKFVVNPYKTRYSFDFLEDAVRKFNELTVERYGDKAKIIPVGEGQTKVIDIISVEDITPEYIDSIKHVELFKLIVKKKGWGGNNGKIKQSYVRANTLNEYKEIAKKLFLEEK